MLNYLRFFTLITAMFYCSLSIAEMKNLALKPISIEHGLSQGTVNSIFQDKTGFLWIGTERGLNYYDGYSIKPFLGPDNIFESIRIAQVSQDENGIIWILTRDEGIYGFDPLKNTFEKVDIINAAENNKPYGMVQMLPKNSNSLWFSKFNKLYFYNKQTKESQVSLNLTKSLTQSDSIYDLLEKDGVIYIATSAGTFAYHYHEKLVRKLPTITASNTKNANAIPQEAHKHHTLYIDDNRLFIGTNSGIYTLDIRTINSFITQTDQLPQYRLVEDVLSVSQFLRDEDKLYVASHKGLSEINLLNDNPKSKFLFSLNNVFETVSDSAIKALASDHNGNIWLSSQTIGAFQWNPTREAIFNYRYNSNSTSGLSNNQIAAIAVDSKYPHVLWLGTANGLNQVNTKTNKVESFITTENNKNMYGKHYQVSVHEDDQRRLWLTGPAGVTLFDMESKKELSLPFDAKTNQQLLNSSTYDTFLDKEQNLWYYSGNGIIKVSLKTEELDPLTKINESLTEMVVQYVLGFLPNSSTLLIATNTELWGFDTLKNTMTLLYTFDGESEYMSYFESFVIDDRNILWLTKPGAGIIGLSLNDFSEKFHYNSSNSIIDNHTYGIMKDAEGDLWFSAHDGIYLLTVDGHHIRRFGVDDGLINVEFNAGAHIALPNMQLAYGGMEGLSIIDPIHLKKERSVNDYRVQITNIEVLSRKVSLPLVIPNDFVIPLNHNDISIRVDFSTFSFNKHANTTYEYKMISDDIINYPETTENHIIFPQLASGKHTFEIQATSPITGEKSEVTRIHFQVSYAPWASPLAFFVYFLIATTWLFVWFRSRRAHAIRLAKAHQEVLQRENRLQLALIGSNSEVWDWQNNNNEFFGKRIHDELGYTGSPAFYSMERHLKLIHPDDKASFFAHWENYQRKHQTQKHFECTYRLKHNDGTWLWYTDLGKVVETSKGEPKRITGSYTNITQSRADKERSQYYGEAFKQTKDWVMIIDERSWRVTANESIKAVFNWGEKDFRFNRKLLGLSRERAKFYRELLITLYEGEHWSGEEVLTAPSGKKHHVIVNVSVSRSETMNTLHYIFVCTDISAQKLAENELRHMANYDFLTGLPNRSLLLERVKHAISVSGRVKKSIGLFFIDLDRFKQINDSLGHECGDIVLQEATKRLKDTLRTDDTVARIGGDEFVVLFESHKDNHYLSAIAEKVITELGKPITVNNNVVSIGASIGIATYPEDATDSDGLLHNADVAMYHAKNNGRNTYRYFTEEMDNQAKQRLKKESDVKSAALKNAFFNNYQPIMNTKLNKPEGFEVLLRWQHDGLMIPPSEFISVIEELGLIKDVTEDTITRAMNDLRQWRKIEPNLYVSINLSSQHFVMDGFVKYVQKVLRKYEMPAANLCFELTENLMIADREKVIETMKALREIGVKLALDDFGTGYSSLQYLKELPINTLKIDRSFVSGIGVSSTDEAIVNAAVLLAKDLKISCIAEGIETPEQLAYLQAKNCYAIQGYLFSKPVDAKKATAILMQNSSP